ncbi:MAG: hypothetical protein CL849_00445 [Crocinitomicaceae bacterium]|nr:hypothetical protein [Crocinitomicaceae bacterium]
MVSRWEGTYMIVGAVLGVLLLSQGFQGTRSFETAALGTMTVSHYAKDLNGNSNHTERANPEEIEPLLNQLTNKTRHILILGNSQTHSINQKKHGQTVYPELLSKTLDSATAVLTHSMPNANFQEFRVSHSWWSEKRDWDLILIPAFMDDLREDGLRKDFLKAPVAEGHQLASESKLSTFLNAQLERLTNPPSEAGSESKQNTPQDITEQAINDWLSEHTSIWRNRSNARGDLFLSLYELRNKAFGITASTPRKMIPARYNRNIEALSNLLDHATSIGQRIILYIPPIRTDVPPPYDAKEYSQFKTTIESMAERHTLIRFANLENTVPGEYWGLKSSTDGDGKPELDYMHFQFKGHQLLAGALENEIRKR